MTVSSDTRKRRLKRVVHLCRAFRKGTKFSGGCERGQRCGPANCEVYRAMVDTEKGS